MRALVTGSTGFIGSRLVPALREDGHEVYELVRYVSGGRYSFYDRGNVLYADLRDREAVRSAVQKCKPEVIVNLAAQTAVSFSFLNPVDVMETNFISVVNLAEIAKEMGVVQFIHASTSEVYGKVETFPITEDMPMEATSPYAIAKIAAEKYLWLQHELYQFPVTVIRPFNTYARASGGIANRHFVVERAICQALEEGHIHLHNPNPVRDFLFREDHVRGYRFAIGNKEAIGQAINLCTGAGHTILEMARLVASQVELATHKHVEVSFDLQPDRPLDIDTLIGSNHKALRILKWLPAWPFNEGIGTAVEEWMEVLGK